MADPICRWRNPSLRQLNEFNLLFPLSSIEKNEGRRIVEDNWATLGGSDFFTTSYQLAAQMGVYYEDDTFMYPRFNKLITLSECKEYMLNWGKKYYAPNPYTKSMRQSTTPVVINRFLVNWVIDKGAGASFSDALKEMFVESIGNTDILINMINNFMDVKVEDNKVYLKDTYNNIKYSIEDVFLEVSPNDKKAFYNFVGENKIGYDTSSKSPQRNYLQQIYYGAPGTGKSYEINRLTEGKEVIRTTFHPDSDYSTFVGAYKPTSVEIPVRDVTGKVIVENGQKVTENRIVYEFVEQSFLQAYTKAWKAYANAESGKKPTEQYLVIEEINRGNCAQIFGDLFQLLDRNKYGFSDYPITADKDMKKQLAKAFKDLTIANARQINGLYKKDVVSQILSGEILLLPDNLFIWATMNTSDQSLFPIDSAFKRRWDWKYIPISEGRTETGENLGWRIKVAGNEYDWCQFMNKINHEIGEITKSEDKKIGYFFCKAEDGIINAETFVGKVIFYLWNDVFKDQDVANIFNDGDNELKFSDFYDATAEGKTTIKEEKIEVFLKNLGIDPISSQDSKSKDTDGNDEEIADEIAQRQRKESLISIQIPNYPIIYTKESTVVDSFVKALTTIGIENILPIVDKLKYQRLKCPVISTQKYQTIENGDSGYSYCQAGSLFIIKGCKTYTYIRILEDLNEMLNVGLTLETR